MNTFLNDLRFGARMLRKQPGFTLAAILSLAIGIGATSTMFSVMNGVLLRPLPYRDADRMAILWNRSPGLNVEQDWFSPGQYLDIKADNQVFEQTAVSIGGSFNLTGQGGPEHLDGARVSASFLPLFGVTPALGRLFLPEEDQPGKAATVLLSHGFWQRRFGGDPGVVGRSLLLNGKSFEIVGVLPAGFSLTKQVMPTVNTIERADVFLALPMPESARTNRGNEDYNIFARVKPGVSFAQAQADMDRLAAQMKRQYPANYPPNGGLTLSVVPLLDQVVGDSRQSVPLLFGAVWLVLLIACANVANLLLARAASREKEMAIRAALGGGRGRLLRQALTESLLLGGFGGLIGLLLTLPAIRLLRGLGPENLPRADAIAMDWRVLLFASGVAMGTSVLFGLAPALRASRVDPNEALKEGGRTDAATGGRGVLQPRKLLVIAEIALSLALLICAGLLIRSYRGILDAHPGFNPRNVMAMRLALPAARYDTTESIFRFYRSLTDRIRALPGVESAAVTYSLPMSTVAFAWEPIVVEGYVPKAASDTIISNVRIVSPGYLRTMGISLLEGREFTEHDTKGEPETAIVDEAFALRFWPNESPIGKRLQRAGSAGTWRTIVGVIRGAKQYSAEKEPPIAVYFPFEQYPARSMYLVARTTPQPDRMVQAIAGELRGLDPELPAFDVASMEQRLHDSLSRRRFLMVLLSAFAGIALLLAAIGIYGVMAYAVAQRTQELGIRIALGAQPRDLLGMVLRQGMALALAGTALGLAGGWGFARLLTRWLFGVGAADPLTFLSVAGFLLLLAGLACWLPARRAARVDPIVVLRNE